MAIRRSEKLRNSRKQRRISRLRAHRRTPRGLRIEALEDRRLLAVGPQLVGIQPNVGELLFDGQVRNTAPRELSLLFNSVAEISESSLPTSVSQVSPYDSIQITRSGLDGTFERASVFSDFNTLGAVQIEFEALAAGQAGSVVAIHVDKAQLAETRFPTVQVQDNQIHLTLNTRVGFETRASDLITAVNAHPEANRLVTAKLRRGLSSTNIATPAIDYSPLVMTAANTAKATSSFNAGTALAIEFTATQTGVGGNGIMIQVSRTNLGEDVLPQVSASGRTIAVVLNSNTLTPTTASQLVTAINSHPQTRTLVSASLRSGDPDTLIGNRTINYSPLVLTGANDVRVELGYLGLGDSPREVIVRFQDHLPDDLYMIEILGSGPTPLANIAGDVFNEGQNFQMTFELNLGPQVIAVVPQPVVRDAAGQLSQLRNVIEVYFNDDDLDPVSAQNPLFYQLIHTRETVHNTDDVIIYPTSVQYSAARDMAVLTFSEPLEQLVAPGTYRLRIGTQEAQPAPPVEVPVVEEPGSSFSTAMDLSGYNLGAGSLLLSSSIVSPLFPLDFPGGNDEPGHRDIPWIETHLNAGGDSFPGIRTIYYNFKDEYGFDPNGQILRNAITEAQKQRAREVFDFYARYLGVNFIESANSGLTIVTGDLRAVDPTVPTGVGGVAGIAGNGMAIMDLQDFDKPGDDIFGGPWFQTAMHEIGHLLGLGHTYDLPNFTIMGSESDLNFGQVAEPVFPGDHDIVHGQFLHRPESNDIDMYEFKLTAPGIFSAETIASRQGNPSLLDTVLTLYRANVDGTGRVIDRELIARNDDYYGKDSFVELYLQPGTYYVGVSAAGNADYDPAIEDSGFGGRSQGDYQLRLNFRPDVNNAIVDATGVALDGNGDGNPGGVHNFWFRAAAPAGVAGAGEPRTLFVDKAAAAGGDGSLTQPFNRIPDALAAARPDDVVRLLGNPGADGDITTLADNLAYQIGFSQVGGAVLEDGATLEVPRGVTVMIDANAVLKLRRARIGVGSSAQGVDRSAGSLQVLGTPRLFDAAGNVIKDATGQPIAGSVYFTSMHDRTIGQDNNPDRTLWPALPGDWGGIVFRNDLDIADANRLVFEQQGIFLDYVNHAEFLYGGGSVFINGVPQSIAPIYMIDARPTITFNTITKGSGAGMSANPNSFEEDNFHAPKFQGIPFTSDYVRVGPEIHHNTLVQNSLNGLFIRVSTAAGQSIETLTKSARWDDTDIVHIVSENLIIQGQAGGPILEQAAPPVNVVTLQAVSGGTLDPGTYEYKIVFVDAGGNEGPPSDATRSVEVTGVTGAVELRNLPRIGQNEPFVARRIYRALVGTNRFERVAQINAEDTVFLDTGTSLGIMLEQFTDSIRARLAGRLAVDPGTIVKLDRSRIDASFGAQLIAEGRDGGPIVFTSLHDVRYGFGGTFDTSLQQGVTPARPGDWSGLYLGHLSKGSLDFAVVAHAGGTSRIEGTFAGFNPVEIHQSEVRIANTKFERNANGLGGQAPANRFGRGTHDDSTVFIRGAQPVIVSNTFVGNAGSVISVNVNALNHLLQSDTGRSTGPIGIVSEVFDNRGPLIRLNRLADNEINGMTVRGGTLTTQGVWDDSDIVHVVRNEIIVPDFHTYGGLRLQSNPQESLVIKLSGPRAGFTATGRELDITDRIGGSLQVVGQPRFPVVFTSLSDDSVGAGFTPDGLPQYDTNGDGTTAGRLPTGPEVNRGLLIDNDVPVEIPGFFSFDVRNGGASDFFGNGGITAQGNTQLFTNENVIFDFTNYIDVGGNGNATDLRYSNVTTPATLIDNDLVVSEGTIQGLNGLINWRVETRMENGISIVFNTLTLTSDQPLGNVRFINYLDEDIRGVSDDILYLTGTPGTNDFRAFTLDGPQRIGFSHGGFLEPGTNLVNATYDGWAADRYANLLFDITGPGTTYTVDGNINLPSFDDPQLGLVYGPADVTTAFAWSVDPNATEARITTLLELIPRNPATTGQPGDWRSLRLAEFSHDRNVDVITEREPRDSTTGADNNKDPENAQFVGRLAPHEKAGDDTLRLGFEIHGVISEPGDVDVYSFQAAAGTEVWFDIDRTAPNLDSVVELIDAQGNIIAQSDDSYAEELGLLALYADPAKIDPRLVNPLRKSAAEFYPESALGHPKDLWSTNLRDAGLRVVLPGSQGTVNTYYVRVRSSNIKPGEARDALRDPARINDGLTTGVYQLQIRLRETDEVPGSTIQFADIRYAQNGIEIFGQPTHSPLTGEAAETAVPNDAFTSAQPLGNLLNADRSTLAVAGALSSLADVDFYRFEVTFDSIQNIAGFTNQVQHLAAIFDIDYADGLARPSTRISVFDANGNLVLHGNASNIADDQPGPLKGPNMDDLSRGSAGTLDPYIGTQELPAGTYYVAISSDARVPVEFEQFYSPNPANPLFRLEPINSVERIVEDHINSNYVTTVSPPQIPVLFDNSTAVPYHLGDVVLFVSYQWGNIARLATVDPFTGRVETTVGNVNRNIADVAMRQDGTLWTFSLGTTDGDAGNYIQINTGNAAITNVGDDGIETWQLNENLDGDEQHDVGYQFRAMTYGNPDIYGSNYLFAVGNRVPGRGVQYNQNVLYHFNAQTGVAVSDPAANRDDFRNLGGGTQIVERGFLDTGADPAGTADTLLLLVEATEVNPTTGATTFRITDGLTFTVDHDADPVTPPITFEFNAGPEIRVRPNPAAGAFVRDGDFFEIDGQIFEFDTGSVVVVNAANGTQIADEALLTITDNQPTPVTRTFEFDKDGVWTAGHIRIPINNGMQTQQLMTQIVNSINGVVGFAVAAESLPNSNRITLRGESSVTGAVSSAPNVVIQGEPGGSGNYVISIEETSDLNEYGLALVSTFDAIAGITAGWDGERVNFSGAGSGDFTRMVQRGVFIDMGSDGATTVGFGIPFLAQDTAEELAVKVAAAIAAQMTPPRNAIPTDRSVTLAGGATFATAQSPLRIAGAAPGGTITGIAFVGNTMYAVTNTGGLFRVNNPSSARFASATYIATSAQDLQGINFQALTAGPVATEDGRYAQMLFATASNGRIYAFDTTGRLQPLFVNGQTSINAGLFGVHGMAFSTLEENPWGIVNGERARAFDPGHGLERTFDQSRYEAGFRVDGFSSLHFGRTMDGNYDWPGGAHGTLESHTFSLAGYSPADKPVLYFNYFAQTQQESSNPATQTPMLDSLRVFISNPSGGWDLLATNNSYEPHELNRPRTSSAENAIQELFDNNTGWRQVRIELDNYAGRDNLQIRIDFATAGTMNVGDSTTVGSDLRIVSGSQLSDGQTFVVGGVTFEIEMGYTLVVPSGGAVNDGNTFRVTRGLADDRVFEFDASGSVSDPSHVPIPFFPAMTPDELTAAIEQAIRGEFAGFRVSVVGNRINLPDADLVSIGPGSTLQLTGSPGTTGLPVAVDSSMLATQVTAVVQQALADRFANGVSEAFKTYDNVVRVIGRNVNNRGPFGLTSQLPGDFYGAFYSNLRGQNNAFEGIYLDDFIIGFAERGEVGINAAGLTTFYANPQLLPNQILTGPYQLEVRQAEKYGESLQGPDRLVLTRSFDTNARLSESHSLFAPPANEISDGQTFTLSDGLNSLTFEFDDVTINDGVTPGNVRIPFNPMMLNFATGDRRPQSASAVAAAIRDAINSAPVQSVLKITAALADGAVSSSTASTSPVVNLFGTVDTVVIDPVLRVTSTTTDGNQLRDALLGGLIEPVGDATFVGGPNSAGFFVGGASSIGIASGIVLTTGDARFVQGPNTSDGSSGLSSGLGDPDLDDYFAPFVTLDATVLEFSFRLAEPGDLFFEFVFSSEEYNEFVDTEFNDVFAFFLNNQNVAFLPGTFDPVTINTVNGGNPYGTGGVNAEFYNNNDRDDGGLYLDVFGHDGFTSVFTAGMADLPAGVHTIKLAIADVGDTVLDSAVFIRAFNVIGPDPRTQIPGVVNTDKGDRNLPRDQGQVIVHSNTISGSLGYGIVVAPGQRSPEGKPHAGPVRVTRELNLNSLVPGVVLTNNLIARNNQGGISFSGDQNLGSVAAATVPFGRIINNTIYGGNVGILVQHNASPTLLNNIVADNAIGISIDASSASTVVGGTLYAGPGIRSSSGNLGDSPIQVALSNDVFINKDLGNFYPRPNSRAIDSSFDSLLDRLSMTTIRQPLGIASSPILAPDFDLFGQRRVDDPDVASPSGLGQNVFKDRGAIDRSDFSGPNAIIVNPRDNDTLGKDRDPRDSYVELKQETLFHFSIQLIDGVPPSNDSYGSGPDRNTVTPQTAIVTKDGVPLQEGGDYRFSYDATSAIIRLTPLAGIWEPDHAYEIHLLNVDTLVIAAPRGDLVNDGDTFIVTTLQGEQATFEFESGYSLVVPEQGGSAIIDGTTFLITRNGTTTTFEFDRNGNFRPGNRVVTFTTTDTADIIAQTIATAIRNASIGLTPQAYSGGFVHVGGNEATVLDVNNTVLVSSGLPGVAEENARVSFVPHESFTAGQMAASIAAAINTGPLTELTAEARQNQVVVIGAESILGISTTAVGAIKDMAGNALQPNRFDGSTAFTVFLGSGFDYGDAPSTYPVLKADNGARHEVVEGFMLGNTIFATVDGQPSPNADADPGDDGVSFAPMYSAYASQVTVMVQGITAERPGYLDAWIDFNRDGDWNDLNEKVFHQVPLVEGVNTLPFNVPSNALAGTTFARFRLSSTGGLAATGPASDGEVEDYRVTILANPWHNSVNPLDVNADSNVNPFDVLLIINLLNRNPGIAIGKLPVPPVRLPGMPETGPLPFYDVNGDGRLLPFDAFQIINYLNSRRSTSGEGEGEGPSDGWSDGDSPASLVSQGLDTGLSGGPLLVTASSSSSSSLSWQPFLASASRGVTGSAAPAAPIYTGLPDPPTTAPWPRDRVVVTDLRGEDLENLLDQIAGEGDDLAALEDARDAFFARFDA